MYMLQLLVNVFGKQLHDEKHPHLKNFYLIIPPLTINYVDHMIAAKEKLNKNNYNGAAFTDDGLVMGKFCQPFPPPTLTLGKMGLYLPF